MEAGVGGSGDERRREGKPTLEVRSFFAVATTRGRVFLTGGNDVQKNALRTAEALRYAPMDAEDNGKNLVALLYVNRASSMHNAGLLDESLRDCDRAIAIMPAYVKAWFRRGKVNTLLRNYETAIHDFEVALSMESSPSGMGHINKELEMISSHFNCANRFDSSCRASKWKKLDSSDEPLLAVLQCVSTPSKGRGMTSVDDIAPASLIHSEEPLAAIMNKSCRETHCHFCFIEVPADVVYCPSCTIPVFCSQLCQEQARGAYIKKKQDNSSWKNFPVDLVNHVMDTISLSNVKSDLQDINYQSIAEHKHECGGSPWSVVLPTDVVLAGRILAKLIEKRRLSGETSKPVELGLEHNYLQIPPKTKLEVHVYAVVLSCCLKHHYGSDYPITGASVSQLVILLSQVKVNSMAVVRMKSFDGHGAFKKSLSHSGFENAFTCSVEQVYRQDISKVANWFLEGPGTVRHINQGCCLNCGTDLDIASASIDSKSAMAEIQRLEGCLNSNEDPHTLIPDALKSLTRLRLVRHQYSKVVAQAEDIFAEAFVQFGEFEPALQHCQSSIEILEKLFDSSSIVIGNELIKLASIQLSLGERSAALHTIKRIEEIFSLYYGSHLVDVCPYVVSLREVIGHD
ncbi:hypothetical protein J5N97_023093 [Dioscorea zingiberensis]|uniref:Uncharacterized protein n=1 Tax=Dioscorea zingiberensis TaxID=325984 RepID=A0A9D5HB71_9LILI|nr:hypothetical protein J5N97_023093 [Dioscorea zingiberensis]